VGNEYLYAFLLLSHRTPSRSPSAWALPGIGYSPWELLMATALVYRCAGRRLLCVPGATWSAASPPEREGLMAAVAFREVQKSFGATKVLHGISLEHRRGRVHGLVGPSGCGKSTLCACWPASRTSRRPDRDRRPRGERRRLQGRDIAMVFQSYALYPHMTVRDNMGFSLKLRKEKQD